MAKTTMTTIERIKLVSSIYVVWVLSFVRFYFCRVLFFVDFTTSEKTYV